MLSDQHLKGLRRVDARSWWTRSKGALVLGGFCWIGLALASPLHSAPVSTDATDHGIDWEEARRFWSFQPPVRSQAPAVTDRDWSSQPLDRFVLATMEEQGFSPSPPADRVTLLRRVTFVLTGLPPTPEQTKDFVRDERPDAYARVVDRLLGSPAFGERMASLWLILARYAEDQAHQVGDDTKHFYPQAHLYRQWVIRAFNDDLPYDEFIRRQLAADLSFPGDTNELPALGFIGLGPKYYNRGRLEVKADEWEDRVDTVTRTFLGLTVACARCHEHKYDPITMDDYYGLAGVFASTEMHNRPLQPEPETGSGKDEETDEDEKKKEKKKQDQLNSMHIVREGEIQNLPIFLRGNVDQKGPEVPRHFLRILSGGEPEPFMEGSGRLELAEAIASRDNPLTARVAVNRLWGLVFGRPLVGSASNFGRLGELPTHPELLDDLAVRFVENGWSIKASIREMVLSSTFRQSSRAAKELRVRDPANRWLARMERRRLSVEMLRDTVLFASGELDRSGGASLELEDAGNRRRTVYARISRLQLNDVLMQFDYPDANVHSAQRATTITPMQKLFLLNSPFMLHQSQALARRIQAGAKTPQEAVPAFYDRLFGRRPSPEELALGIEFLSAPDEVAEASGPADDASEFSIWDQYAQALLVSNEMLYLD